MIPDGVGQPIGKIEQRLNARGRRQSGTNDADLDQALAFNKSVGELSGADHHALNARGNNIGLCENRAYGVDNAAADVGCGRCFE